METTLSHQQIVDKLNELKEVCSIRWSRKKDKFVVRKKIYRISLSRVPVRVYVRGTINEKINITQIDLSLAPVMNLADLLIYIIPTLFIMFYTGEKMGVSSLFVGIMFVFSMIFVFTLSYFITKFTETGREICQETFDMLKRQLLLKEISD